MAATYQYLQQSVAASLIIGQKDSDSFFHPVTLNHTGFAYDGFAYVAGVQNPASQASWFLELSSPTRGAAVFPSEVLVVLSQASLSMLDTTDETVVLWMLFYYMDLGCYANNFSATVASFSPQSLTWGNGRLSVVSAYDPGSPFSLVAVLTIDFVADQAYVDYSV